VQSILLSEMLFLPSLSMGSRSLAEFFLQSGEAMLESNIELAREALRRAIHLDDRCARAYYLLGISYLHEDQADQALGYITKAFEVEPGNADVAEKYRALIQRQSVLRPASETEILSAA
jgi:tetratricopeptide (TPR) repeat protein